MVEGYWLTMKLNALADAYFFSSFGDSGFVIPEKKLSSWFLGGVSSASLTVAG